MTHFITSNRYKRDEVRTLLAGIDITWTRLSLPRPVGATLEERAEARARAAFGELTEACFAEVSELRTPKATLCGADFKKAVDADGEAAFFADHAGPARASVAVAYRDDRRSEVFRGDLEGQLLSLPRGDAGFGWDAHFVPDGGERTLAELEGHKAFVNMRLRPYVELADLLRGRSYGGVFEAHITVETKDAAELARFDEVCAGLGVKSIHIALPRGVTRFQPMTGSYHHGELSVVQGEVLGLARQLAGAGFRVTRAKIEATGANRDIPLSDEEAAEAPENYFEYHIKVRLPRDAEVAALTALAESHGAHLSRNARKIFADGTSERFVTLRVYDVGKRSADERFEALREALGGAGHSLSEPTREYTVYDSNTKVDDGWLNG